MCDVDADIVDAFRRDDPDAVELRAVLAETADALPPAYRTALLLHDVEGWSEYFAGIGQA